MPNATFHPHTTQRGFLLVRAARVLRVMTRASNTATVSTVAHRLTTRAKSISFPNATAAKTQRKLSYAVRVRMTKTMIGKATMVAHLTPLVLGVECAIVIKGLKAFRKYLVLDSTGYIKGN